MQAGLAAAEQGWEKGFHFVVHRVERGLETGFGFMVDLGDGFFQQIDGSLHVFALPAVIIVALFGLFQFLQCRQIYRAQAAHGLLSLADGLLQSVQIIALPRFLRQSRLVCRSSLQTVVETPRVQQSLLLLQQQLLRRRLQFGQPCG